MTPIRALLSMTLALAALGQATSWGTGAASLRRELATVRADLARDEVSFEPSRLAAQVQRALPELVARIPLDARVLLVSGHPLPVQFEHLLLPRPFRLLQRLEPGVFDEARARWPHLAEPIERARRRMQQLELALTPERLAAALDGSDHLVTFLWPDGVLGDIDLADGGAAMAVGVASRPVRLERVAGNAWATVWRLDRDG